MWQYLNKVQYVENIQYLHILLIQTAHSFFYSTLVYACMFLETLSNMGVLDR